MSLIIRIDVDRPYGRQPFYRHLLSKLSSDLYFPKFERFGYLDELRTMLQWLNHAGAPAHVFFRRCTFPSAEIVELLNEGGHEIGLHLENSRSFAMFTAEKRFLERHCSREILSMSKHGSGGAKYGFHHYAPYEPERYMQWAGQASMRLFLGNLEDPTIEAIRLGKLLAFPSAFWLEPAWRDTAKFPVQWLIEHAGEREIVLLVHPENVLADSQLTAQFKALIGAVRSITIQ